MTKRAFIRCPLEAALAAKNFGMKFGTPITDDEDESWWPMHYNPDERFCGVFVRDSGDAAIVDKYYIADESLPLLEPQSDDIMMHYVEYVTGYGGVNEKEYYLTWKETKPYYDGTEKPLPEFHPLAEPIIIRRNGKPFPTIEYEDAP